MEVRSGYKQTEVGVIPADWQLRPLLTAVRVASGQVDPKIEPFRSMTLVAPDHIESGSGRLLQKQTAEAQRAISGKYLFAAGDIVYSKIRPYLRKAILADFDGLCSADMYPLKPAPDVSVGFVFASLLGHHFSSYAESVSVRSGMPKINRVELAEYIMALPSTKDEQEAIAVVLSDADALIESLEQLLRKKRDLKQGTMQALLTGKKRLPGFELRAGYEQTQAGPIPTDWEVKRLGELFEITSSKRVFQSEWKTEGIPFYRARELAVLGENGYVENELFITEERYHTFKNAYGIPEVGDMLVTGVGTLGKAYVVSDDRPFYFKDGNIIWFKIKGTVNSDFLKQLFLTRVIIKQIEDASAGTTVGTYTITGAKKTIIPLPSLAEQEAVAEVLSDMDAEIATLEAKLTKTRQLKLGMMQELLTGRTRLI
jgi:type I restriction enzyme, S subunit